MTALGPSTQDACSRESLRCLRCSSRRMHRSGREPYRVECESCGSHYYVVMQLIPVDHSDKRASSEEDVGGSTRAT